MVPCSDLLTIEEIFLRREDEGDLKIVFKSEVGMGSRSQVLVR